jgi:hypothetical protein
MSPAELEQLFWRTYERFYSYRSIARRLLWPPHFFPALFNVIARRSVAKRIHPLMGFPSDLPFASQVISWVVRNSFIRKLINTLERVSPSRGKES